MPPKKAAAAATAVPPPPQTKADEPPAKKAKTEEAAAEAKAEEAKVPGEVKKDVEMEAKDEAPKEQEVDDKADKRPAIKETVAFDSAHMTLNVVAMNNHRGLMALSEGGMQYLIAGARACAGIKAGRYLFEVRVIEALNPVEPGMPQRGRAPQPRQLVRLGFSTEKSSLILGDDENSICFDSEGFYCAAKKRTNASVRFGRDQVIGLLLNLDPKSPNANTVSLFRAGERISQPQAIPEHLIGKPLFPHVAFRNVSLQVHFGPQALKALPFKCRTIQEAAAADVSVLKAEVPKDGKYEVMMPVGFPDEGTFDWLDDFLEKNPKYQELSDRFIVEWARASGIWKPKSTSWNNSLDKPEFNFGIPGIDDMSVRRSIYNLAPVIPRNYVIMEVKQNLIKEERAQYLKMFPKAHFKRVANVVMGEPDAEFQAKVQKAILGEKQEAAKAEWQLKKIENQKKKALEDRQKRVEEMRKKSEEMAKKQAEEKKAAEKEGEAKDDSEKKDDEKKEDESKEGEKKEEEPKEDEKMESKEEEEEEECPTVELTEEEQKTFFHKKPVPDIAGSVLSKCFGKFTIPTKEEGFDDVRYAWQGEQDSNDYLLKWVKQRKLTSRIEELQPSDWFKTKFAEWQKMWEDWQEKQKAYAAVASQKDAEKRAKQRAEAAAKAKAAEEAGEEKKDEEKKEEEGEGEGEKADEIDIFALDNIIDIDGEGTPLFGKFTFEDWALLQLRLEMYLLLRAFRKDVDDPDRPGIHESNLQFYYSRYFRKQLTSSAYGKENMTDLFELIKDTTSVDPSNNVLVSSVASGEDDLESMDILVKLTEECRRERQRRIDAGDETARLTFTVLQQQIQQRAQQQLLQQQAAAQAQVVRPMTRPGPPAPSAGLQGGKGPQKGGWGGPKGGQKGGPKGGPYGGGAPKGGGKGWQGTTPPPPRPAYGAQRWGK